MLWTQYTDPGPRLSQKFFKALQFSLIFELPIERTKLPLPLLYYTPALSFLFLFFSEAQPAFVFFSPIVLVAHLAFLVGCLKLNQTICKPPNRFKITKKSLKIKNHKKYRKSHFFYNLVWFSNFIIKKFNQIEQITYYNYINFYCGN